jgi:Flp pilus assembly pilin Flp
MVALYVWVQTWVTELMARDEGDIAIEWIVLAAVLGGGVLAGATVFRGAVVSAFNRLSTSLNGVG